MNRPGFVNDHVVRCVQVTLACLLLVVPFTSEAEQASPHDTNPFPSPSPSASPSPPPEETLSPQPQPSPTLSVVSPPAPPQVIVAVVTSPSAPLTSPVQPPPQLQPPPPRDTASLTPTPSTSTPSTSGQSTRIIRQRRPRTTANPVTPPPQPPPPATAPPQSPPVSPPSTPPTTAPPAQAPAATPPQSVNPPTATPPINPPPPPTFPPVVTLINPPTGATFPASTTITLQATVNRPVTVVVFFANHKPIGVATTNPYVFLWTNVPVGTYYLWAKAVDTNNVTSISQSVSIEVRASTVVTPPPTQEQPPAPPPPVINQPPSLTVSGPTTITREVGQAISVLATARDPERGGIRVDLLPRASTPTVPQGLTATAVLTDLDGNTPVRVTWTPSAAGTVEVTLRARDPANQEATVPLTFVITPTTPAGINQLPIITLTQLTTGQSFIAPATIELKAAASDPDGIITKVEFFNGAVKLGEDTSAPYAFTWPEVDVGTYTLKAVATDNAGATATSTVELTVAAPTDALVTLSTPSDGAVLTNSTVEVRYTLSPTRPAGALAYLRLDNGRFGVDTDADGVYQLTGVSEGAHTLTIFLGRPDKSSAAETRLRTATTRSRSFTIQPPPPNQPTTVTSPPVSVEVMAVSDPGKTTPPVIHTISPKPGPGLYAGETHILSAFVTPSTSSRLHYRFFIDRELRRDWSPESTYAWATTAEMAGTHVVMVEVRDEAGNASAHTGIYYLYRKPPQLPSTTPPQTPTQATTPPQTPPPATTPPQAPPVSPSSTPPITAPPAQPPVVTPPQPVNPPTVTPPANPPPPPPSTTPIGQPPAINFFSPANGARFTEGATIPLKMNAFDIDPGDRVILVEFFAGSEKIAQATTLTSGVTFSGEWTNVRRGSYSLTARATDTRGVSTTSSAIFITVDPPPPPSAQSNQPPTTTSSPTSTPSTSTPSSPRRSIRVIRIRRRSGL